MTKQEQNTESLLDAYNATPEGTKVLKCEARVARYEEKLRAAKAGLQTARTVACRTPEFKAHFIDYERLSKELAIQARRQRRYKDADATALVEMKQLIEWETK